MDNLSKKERSHNMSRIRSFGTKPELVVEQFLKDFKVKYKKNHKSFPGTPDFYLPQINAVIFVHGCFWHAHRNCKYFRVPLSNQSYWNKKFDRNKKRDRFVKSEIKKLGVKAIVIWGCEIINGSYFLKLIDFLEESSRDHTH